MKKSPRHRIMSIIGMSFLFFLILMLGYGYSVGQYRYRVHQQTFCFSDLPDEFDGYRIVQFTDMHIGTLKGGHEQKAQEIIDLINKQKPDAVMFTGDLVNRNSSELEGFQCILSSLTAPDGVYAILGNHDYALYTRQLSLQERSNDTKRLLTFMRGYGWNTLVNQNVILKRGKARLAVVGVENQGYAKLRFPKFARLDKAMNGVRPDDFVVLLSHDPTHWRHDITGKTTIQLTLSGHTHAGQFKIFGWSPVKYVYPEWSGVYTEGNQILNVSDGVGTLLPFRFGAWPEINVITLKKSKK